MRTAVLKRRTHFENWISVLWSLIVSRQFGHWKYPPSRKVGLVSTHTVLLACVLCIGCKPSPAPKPVTPPKTPPTPVASETGAPSEAASDQEDLNTEETTPTSEDVEQTESAEEKNQPPEEALAGTWTSQKLVAYTRGGPRIIEFSINVAGKSLEEVADDITKSLADELFEEMESPVTWEALLEQPLVQSGWLGNLVAEEDQKSQLITMYDEERDDNVSLEELGPFLSRGLARSTPLQITDIGNAPDADPTLSPFGKIDQNSDYTVTADELEDIEKVISQFDYNGDAIVSAQEVARNDTTDSNNSMSMSMLETNTMLVVAPGKDEEEISINLRRYAGRIHEHYTFLSGIPREEWSAWTDERWQVLDENADQLLVRNEVEKIFDIPADVEIRVRLPALEETDGKAQVWVLNSDMQLLDSWVSKDQSSKFELGGLNVKLDLEDAFTGSGPKQLRGQLANALKEPQLKNFFTQQLQLQEDAFELIDTDENEELSDEEFERVWHWLSARQGSRLISRWMTARRPWFQLLDVDSDNRLSAYEIQQSQDLLRSLDVDSDGTIAPNELPLIARMEIKRTDQRLDNRFPIPQQNPDAPEMPQDWFSAMDTNADGFISEEEFLGDSSDFSDLDADSDGFIGRSEVY